MYLGHIISFEGVKVDPSKVAVMLDWPTPANVKSLWGFMDLTNFKHYRSIGGPLTQLLKKNGFFMDGRG